MMQDIGLKLLRGDNVFNLKSYFQKWYMFIDYTEKTVEKGKYIAC